MPLSFANTILFSKSTRHEFVSFPEDKFDCEWAIVVTKGNTKSIEYPYDQGVLYGLPLERQTGQTVDERQPLEFVSRLGDGKTKTFTLTSDVNDWEGVSFEFR
jgi:hypothetical protein